MKDEVGESLILILILFLILILILFLIMNFLTAMAQRCLRVQNRIRG